MLIENLEYPSETDFNNITESFIYIKNLHLDLKLDGNHFNQSILLLPANSEFTFWMMRFNNKLGKTRFSYVLLKYYFLKGIPDDEWFISPGRNGCSLEYFPHFQEIHHVNNFLFSYYYEIFYYDYFSALDILHHLFNIYFNINIDHKKHKNNFSKLILQTIKDKEFNLFNLLIIFNKNKSMIKARKIRNDLTHNYPPYEVDSGIKRNINGNKETIIQGMGEYTPSKDILNNIENIITLFHNLLIDIKKELNNNLIENGA